MSFVLLCFSSLYNIVLKLIGKVKKEKRCTMFETQLGLAFRPQNGMVYSAQFNWASCRTLSLCISELGRINQHPFLLHLKFHREKKIMQVWNDIEVIIQ